MGKYETNYAYRQNDAISHNRHLLIKALSYKSHFHHQLD